jgi:hypothetical protein
MDDKKSVEQLNFEAQISQQDIIQKEQNFKKGKEELSNRIGELTLACQAANKSLNNAAEEINHLHNRILQRIEECQFIMKTSMEKSTEVGLNEEREIIFRIGKMFSELGVEYGLFINNRFSELLKEKTLIEYEYLQFKISMLEKEDKLSAIEMNAFMNTAKEKINELKKSIEFYK